MTNSSAAHIAAAAPPARRFANHTLPPLLLALGSAGVLVAAARVAGVGYLNDDALITLTYAKNLAAGNGFVFNHPPASLGTTTPLLALVLATLAWLLPGLALVDIAVYFTALCWVGVMWTFYWGRAVWGLARWHAVVTGLALAGYGWLALLGMETYLFAFLLVLSCTVYLQARPFWAGVLVGLLCLTRGEGALLLPVLFLHSYWQLRAQPFTAWLPTGLRLAAGFALPVSLWAAFALVHIGTFLPNTLGAKQAQAQSDLWRSFPERLIFEWAPNWKRQFALPAAPWLNLWWGLVIIGLLRVLRTQRAWLLPVGWMALYVAGYSVLNVSGYAWYQMPILLVLQCLFALGIVASWQWIARVATQTRVALAINLVWTAWLLWLQAAPLVTLAANYTGDGRGPSYTALATWLQTQTPADASVAYIEIGYLGYYTDRHIVDLAGLVLPDIVPHVAAGDFAWGFWRYRPDYYVHWPDFAWALGAVTANERFAADYRLVATLPSPGANDLAIYQRVTPE